MTAATAVVALDWDELARFWSNVEVCHKDLCWPWRGARDAHDYGAINVKGRIVKAHRVAYSLAHGDSVGEMHIRHACDNPPCCNPAHLLTGTHADNMADAVSRGRNAFGERVGSAKLTEEQARVIWDMKGSGLTSIFVGRMFGITESAVRGIWYGKTWKRVTGMEFQCF